MPEETYKIQIKDGVIPGLCILRRKQSIIDQSNFKSRPSFGATDVDQWIKNTLLDMISSAKKKIFLATFLMDYPEVEEVLMEASERLKGHVYVLSPLDKSVYKEQRNQSELSPEELALAIQQQEKRILALSKSGVYIREHPACHAKFCVVDSERALIMTSNLTVRSMEENPELGMVIEKDSDVRDLDTMFQRMWVHGATREVIPSMTHPDSRTIPKRSDRNDSIEFEPKNNINWTYHNQHFILSRIIDRINSAISSLKIGSYVLRELHPDEGENEGIPHLIAALKDALSRGVNIEIVLHVGFERSGIIENEKETKTYMELFSSAKQDQVKIFGHPKNHAKYVVADESSAIFFSANLDGRYGLTNGIEIGLELSDNHDIDWLTDYHRKLINESHTEILSDVMLSSLKDEKNILGKSIRTLVIRKKTMIDARRVASLTTRVIEGQYLNWSSLGGDHETIMIEPWESGTDFLVARKDISQHDSYFLENAGNKQKKDADEIQSKKEKGFIIPGEVSVVVSWPYNINELKKLVNDKVRESLRDLDSIKLSTINAAWFDITQPDILFEDTEENWLSRLRHLLLDGNLEMRDSEWWIRPPIQDKEILEIIDTHIEGDRMDITAVMSSFESRGWNISGVTTGPNVLREYYGTQRNVTVKRDGTIEAES